MSDHLVTDVGEEILATYNLCVVGPTAGYAMPIALTGAFAWGSYLREAQENLTDLLPDGYRVVIKEWSSE